MPCIPHITIAPYRCSICGKDISNYNEARRQQHMNRCCDQSEVQTKSTNQNQSINILFLVIEKYIQIQSLNPTDLIRKIWFLL